MERQRENLLSFEGFSDSDLCFPASPHLGSLPVLWWAGPRAAQWWPIAVFGSLPVPRISPRSSTSGLASVLIKVAGLALVWLAFGLACRSHRSGANRRRSFAGLSGAWR
jgi:hypothetical protein